MSTSGRLSKVWLTHTNVASQWSAEGFIRPEEWIISPASLLICWTFPHSSIVACWGYFQMVEMWTPICVKRAAVIDFNKPDSNNVLPVPCWTTMWGHRSMQVGSSMGKSDLNCEVSDSERAGLTARTLVCSQWQVSLTRLQSKFVC